MLEAYREYSRIYDQVHERRVSSDVPFWLSEAVQAGSPILELACGSGRIALPLVRYGLRTHGIDNSSEMLQLLQQKVSLEPESVRNLLTWELADMKNFPKDTKGKYAFAFVAFSALQYLYKKEEQQAVFSRVHQVLKEGGIFIVDVFNPNPAFVQGWGEPITLAEVKNSPEGEDRIVWECLPEAYDEKSNILIMPNRFQIYHAGREDPETITIPAQYYCFSQEELEQLFREAGFGNVETFRNYTKEPFTPESPQIIMKGRKVSQNS
mgnify:CR=1 FL=1